MSLVFNTVSLNNDIQQTLRISEDNILELAESLNGILVEGVMSFQISNHKHYVMVGDWVVLFDRGRDVLIFTDKMYQRLFKSV